MVGITLKTVCVWERHKEENLYLEVVIICCSAVREYFKGPCLFVCISVQLTAVEKRLTHSTHFSKALAGSSPLCQGKQTTNAE